jgi:hypothetical protein
MGIDSGLFKGCLSKAYNHEELFAREIEPLFNELHAKCKEHNIPLVMAICSKNDPEAQTTGGQVASVMPCTDTIPPQFVAARIVLDRPELPEPLVLMAMEMDKLEPKAEVATIQ